AHRHQLEIEAQPFVRAGQIPAQPLAELGPSDLAVRLELEAHSNLVANIVLVAPNVDLELVDRVVLADYRFHRARVDVGAADELHVVPTAADTTVIDIARAPASTVAVRNAHHDVSGAVADKRDKAAAERGHHPFA